MRLVIVPAPAVQGVLETGVAAGLKSATVYAAQLGEGNDPEIVARGTALKALIERSGLVMCGPNCMGFNALREKNFGYPNTDLCALTPGSVAFVTQSGGTVQYIGSMGAHRGVNFNYLISSGNELSVDLADYVNFFAAGRQHARHRAVRRGHPPPAGVHGGGGEGAGRRQADRRDQDRKVAEGARQRAVAHRRHRRRLRRLHRDVRALRHRRVPVARRHDRDAARCSRPAACRRGRASAGSRPRAARSISCSTTSGGDRRAS